MVRTATIVWSPETDRGWGALAFNAKLLAYRRGRGPIIPPGSDDLFSFLPVFCML